jgi:hypothetical protein
VSLTRKPAVFLAAILLALSLPYAHAQTSALYRIAGHIISASDSHPLQRASVNIYTTGDNRLISSTTADEQGAFAFPNVKSGAYVLEGSASGYIAARYLEHDGYNTAIVTGAGVDTESLVLKLALKASISGRVTDQNGDPVPSANMVVYRETRENGLTRISHYGHAQTDDTGAYEVTGLPAGKYFVSAAATPWYAVRPQQPIANNGLGIVPGIDPSIDVAYPVTFYPEVTDSSQATPIVLRPGDQPEIDLRLNALPALSIVAPTEDRLSVSQTNSSKLATFGQGPPLQRYQFQVFRQIFGNLEQVGYEQRITSSGTSLVGLPPGQYVLKQINPQHGGIVRSLSVNLADQAIQIEPASGQELANLTIKVKTTNGSDAAAQQLSVQLLPPGANAFVFPQGATKDGVSFKGIDPGDYDIRVALGNKPCSILSLVADGKPLSSNRIHINAGSNASITLTATPASANLAGFARIDGKPAPGAMILLLPADSAQYAFQSRRDQSDLDGSFHLLGIPPGRYILLAIQEGWDLEFQREGALDHYLPLATPVTIPDGADTSIKLPEPLAVQPR